MAPAKKAKKRMDRGVTTVSDSSPSKDDKSNQKKRKLSDLLGPVWSRHEIERFYGAYRKYGHNWKKVAGAVRTRNIGMIEAFYIANQAYLSLPEGTASVVGFIALVTDHYNVLDGSGSEKESEEPEVMVRKIQKNPKAKGLFDSSRDDSKHQFLSSTEGCLSLLKNCGNGIQLSFPVKKRTPRVPVSFLDVHPNKKPRVSVRNTDDTAVSHGDFTVKETWHIPNSPHGLIRSTQDSYREEVTSQFPVLKGRISRFSVDEESKQGSLGCNRTKIENLARNTLDSGKSVLIEYKDGKQEKKGKNEEVQQSKATLFDNIRETYKYGDKGPRRSSSGEKSVKIGRSTSEGRNKRSKKLTFEDELETCDALHTLAEMSSLMPYLDAEPVYIEVIVGVAKESVTVQDMEVDSVTHTDVALSIEKSSGEFKEKQMPRAKSVADKEMKSGDSCRRTSVAFKKCEASLRSPDVSSSSGPRIGDTEVAVSSAQVHHDSQVVNLARRKFRRKRDRTSFLKDSNYAPYGCSSDHLSAHSRLENVKGKLLHCLWHEVRRWCIYEWFYSAIDYPWFAKREFVEYLEHVGLGHIPRLTRIELGVIRGSLGKPRRFSENFLLVEREKLKQYRESVRTFYAKLRAGVEEGLPTDLACPPYVGQQVVAIHPKTKECHSGSVLTVDHDKCLVQFHHPVLGVEPIMDIDCMPLNPLEKIPEALKRQNMLLFDYRYMHVPQINGAIISSLEEHTKDVDLHRRVTSPSPSFAADMKVFDQQRSCPDNPPWPLPVTAPVGSNGTMHSLHNSCFSDQETASNVAEIVEGSRDKAQRMVDTAVKAMSVMKEGEDAFGRISEALEANGKVECATYHGMTMTMPSNSVRGSLPRQSLLTSCATEPPLSCDAFVVQSAGGSLSNDSLVPSDLITSCVATLLMIQTCTERQYPPAEVVQILDNAATSLHPCCPQNLSIYRELQMCMGRIKTQILALVPTK